MAHFFCLLIIFFLSPIMTHGFVNTEIFRSESLDKKLSQQVDFGWTFNEGNTKTSKTKIGYRVDTKVKDISGFVVTSFQKMETNSKTISDHGFIHVRGSKIFFKSMVLESFFQHEYDEFRDLSSRILFGGGRRFDLSHHKAQLYLGVGAMLENETLQSQKKTLQVIRSTNYLSFNILLKESITCLGILYVQPSFKAFDDIHVYSDIGLTFLLTDTINIKNKLQVRYDSTPPAGISKHDLNFTTSLGITF